MSNSVTMQRVEQLNFSLQLKYLKDTEDGGHLLSFFWEDVCALGSLRISSTF